VRTLTLISSFLIAVACDVDEPPPPPPSAQGSCDISDVGFCDALQGGISPEEMGEVLYGTPPQGGAPYAPFTLRFSGLDQPDEGLLISMTAVDTITGEVLADNEYGQWLACANVGDHAGWLVGPEFHLRFFGYELEELEGRTAEFIVVATDVRGVAAEQHFVAALTQ